MYFNGPTETDAINQFVADATDLQDEKLIQRFVEEHDKSEMETGVRYYFNDNDIRYRDQYYINEVGDKVVDLTKPNNRIAHGFMKLLVDQKKSYIAGKEITMTSDDDALLDSLNEIMGEEFADTLGELVKGASNKGVEYLHPYIDADGNFDYIITPAEQIIPLYESNKQKKLEYVIRYYPWMVNDKETIRAEWWDKNTVTYYIRDGAGKFRIDEETQPHFNYGEDGFGWGEVPFVEFKNNEEKKPDITWIKDEIDDYDKVKSDLTNNFDEIQAFIYVLKNFDGTDLNEFMSNLRYFKAIKVDDDGGVDKLVSELPIASVDSQLDRTNDNIIRFGQGVDMSTDSLGNNPTNLALKVLFSGLDMKADTLIAKFKKALERFVWFATEYLIMSGQLPEGTDYKSVSYTFNKSVIMNESEIVDMAQKSKGVISDETVLANHPWVTDVEAEKERLKEQKEEMMNAYPELDPAGAVDEQPTGD